MTETWQGIIFPTFFILDKERIPNKDGINYQRKDRAALI